MWHIYIPNFFTVQQYHGVLHYHSCCIDKKMSTEKLWDMTLGQWVALSMTSRLWPAYITYLLKSSYNSVPFPQSSYMSSWVHKQAISLSPLICLGSDTLVIGGKSLLRVRKVLHLSSCSYEWLKAAPNNVLLCCQIKHPYVIATNVEVFSKWLEPNCYPAEVVIHINMYETERRKSEMCELWYSTDI